MPLEIRQDTHFSCSHNISFFVVKHQTTFTFIRLLQKNGPILAWCFVIGEKSESKGMSIRLSCSMTTSRRILKRALSGIFWRRRRRRSDVLRKDIFAVVDYLWIHIFFREISFSALCSGVWNLLTKEMKSISISSRISRFNDENSRSRLELRDSMMKNLDLVSKHEIQWWKISISKISISNHMIGR